MSSHKFRKLIYQSYDSEIAYVSSLVGLCKVLHKLKVYTSELDLMDGNNYLRRTLERRRKKVGT